MRDEGVVLRPKVSISLSSRGSEAEVFAMSSAWGSETVLMTNWPEDLMLRTVSLGLPVSGRLPMPRTTRGGLEPNTLKKLNGAALIVPSGERLVTQAMGRGMTTEVRKR